MYAKLIFVDDGYIHPVSEETKKKIKKKMKKKGKKKKGKIIKNIKKRDGEIKFVKDIRVKIEEDEVEVNDEEKIIDHDNIYKILSIDIGVVHLGLSISIVDLNFNLKEIIWVKLVDITKFHHRDGVTRKTCDLHHDKTMSDWLDHVFLCYEEFFEQCDYILLERQPPMGFVVVEQLIFSRYRDKAVLISPNSMHKYFNIRILDYDQRKVAVEKICEKYIDDKYGVKEDYFKYERKHDMADSVCIMLYWINKKRKQLEKEKNKNRIMQQQLIYRNSTLTLDEWFEQFRYRGAIH